MRFKHSHLVMSVCVACLLAGCGDAGDWTDIPHPDPPPSTYGWSTTCCADFLDVSADGGGKVWVVGDNGRISYSDNDAATFTERASGVTESLRKIARDPGG